MSERESSGERRSLDDLRDVWPVLDAEDRVAQFKRLSREDAYDFFMARRAGGQATIIRGLPERERELWTRVLAPDDAADLLQEVSPTERAEWLAFLDETTRREVVALMAYAEDDAGGLMSPRYARLRPDIKVGEALTYLRRQAQGKLELLYYVYVIDAAQRLVGVVSFRELFRAPDDKIVSEIMERDLVTAAEDMDQEAVAKLIAQFDLVAIPVVDREGHMKGIVTVDDIVDVVQDEATEDIQKIGGMQALEVPYFQTGLATMVRKRAGWLLVLFVGEALTASAMSEFEEEIKRAVILATFVPLIISSGGNSGSQASTLIIRAMALGEVRLRDWWRVIRREALSGVALGCILGTLGFLRIVLGELAFSSYGEHHVRLAIAVSTAVLGVVTWGTLSGSMLPFVLRRLKFDPASASAPFVATMVDVTGLLLYFNIARYVLEGTLL